MSTKINTSAVENQMMEMAMKCMGEIYANKSSDEFKSHGDITLSSEYDNINKMIADLKTIIGFPDNDIKNIKTLFNTLHRPVFKTMVIEYIASPNERNSIFTAVYTVGFRVLIGELSRIYASTVATDKGIKYKPNKISKRNDMTKFIVSFNDSTEKRIDAYIRSANNKVTQEGAIADVAAVITKTIYPEIKICLCKFFNSLTDINPVSAIGSILMARYDRKVNSLAATRELYETTYEAYREYMRKPDALRSKKVEDKYIKNIDKYNIKMQNLQAKIEHYDQRAKEDLKDAVKTSSATAATTKSDVSTADSGDDFGF